MKVGAAHFQVEVMEVATIRSDVSFSTVYLSCKNPEYPLCVVFRTWKSFRPDLRKKKQIRLPDQYLAILAKGRAQQSHNSRRSDMTSL